MRKKSKPATFIVAGPEPPKPEPQYFVVSKAPAKKKRKWWGSKR